MTERRDDHHLERILRDAAPVHFAGGFSGRVAMRLARDRLASAGATLGFGDALQRSFVRVVPLLAAASLLLGLYSWWGGRASADSLLDATLRLPQVSIATAYPSDLFYGGNDTGGDN